MSAFNPNQTLEVIKSATGNCSMLGRMGRIKCITENCD